LILRPASDNAHFMRPVIVNRFPTPDLGNKRKENKYVNLHQQHHATLKGKRR